MNCTEAQMVRFLATTVFEMLSQFRSMFEQTQSLLMDLPTLKRHSNVVIQWPNHPNAPPAVLTESEQATYDYLLTHRIRLEQERIPQADVNEQLIGLGLISGDSLGKPAI